MTHGEVVSPYAVLLDALASDVRWRIMEMIAEKEMNAKEIAAGLSLSPSIVTVHIRKLEQAGLVGARRIRLNGGTHKLCYLKQSAVTIRLPTGRLSRSYVERSIPVGHYTSLKIHPTCGIATTERIIGGSFDDPQHFHDPERVNASVLWFGKGYIEYRIPCVLASGQVPEELEIAMEIASEAPGVRDRWPSDIRFCFNGVDLGTWTSPADFGRAARGKHTPEWWQRNVNQYGVWKTIQVNGKGTFLDGEILSTVTIGEIDLQAAHWTWRMSVEDNARHIGGLTLYGAKFGNYDKDIVLKVYYR